MQSDPQQANLVEFWIKLERALAIGKGMAVVDATGACPSAFEKELCPAAFDKGGGELAVERNGPVEVASSCRIS